jgi:hypothetical protein
MPLDLDTPLSQRILGAIERIQAIEGRTLRLFRAEATHTRQTTACAA